MSDLHTGHSFNRVPKHPPHKTRCPHGTHACIACSDIQIVHSGSTPVGAVNGRACNSGTACAETRPFGISVRNLSKAGPYVLRFKTTRLSGSTFIKDGTCILSVSANNLNRQFHKACVP
jgi:hypothetical protein